ncbi:flagellar hook-associated protein FlgK [Skermanella sp. TT6]|uniref:Flagellar hook-associated protein 1 n=1 Tax=Skermanella cutis TaxID=2775420 RepID=A0ABX7B640_9PROT|nr:flagellar hook-associated protein FlgK [Skermanella sp. TT6]QQP88848.1 flagellar hook-associated protein FlgK [Skermanella sp. TT6]
MVDQMGLDVSLRTAMSGLRTVQQGLDVVSRNIANADTPGYTRKIQTQYTQVIQGQSVGVQTGNVEREVDTALQNEVRKQGSRVANLTVQERYLSQVETLHGDPGSESSLGNVLNRMKDGFTRLMDTPNSVPLQNEVVSLADTVARTLNRVADGINDIRTQVQVDIENALTDLNNQFQRVDDLNRQIRSLTATGQSQPDLEDQRDEALRKISEQIEVNVMRRGDGTVSVLDRFGQPYLEAGYQPLSISQVSINPQAAYPGAIDPIRLGDPATGTDVTGRLSQGGSLGGLLQLRDQTLPRFQAQLDEFAQTMGESFESAGLLLFTDSTGVVPVDDPLASPPTSSVGFANQIRVAQAVIDTPSLLRDGSPIVPGTAPANSNLLRTIVDGVLGGNRTFQTTGLGPNADLGTVLPGSATLASFAAELVSHQTNLRASTTAQLEPATTLRDHLRTKLSDQSGVNLDQEVSLLIQLQRSYSSSAQVVSTNRQLFNDLISILR